MTSMQCQLCGSNVSLRGSQWTNVYMYIGRVREKYCIVLGEIREGGQKTDKKR